VKYYLKILFIAIMSFSAMLTTCTENPANPYDISNTKIYLYARSEARAASSTGIEDSVGNIIEIGVTGNLPSNIDSVELITKDSVFAVLKGISSKDTLWASIVFTNTGTKTITGTAYINNNTTYSASITATIHAKPVNHKPDINVTGKTSITFAQTCTLAVTVSDSDISQTHSYDTLRTPTGSTFSGQVFIWKPASGFIGKDTVIFMVTDNGYPVMSDTNTTVITVSDTGTKINHPPVWQDDTIKLAGNVGNKISLTLSTACSDTDGDTLTYTLLPGTPTGDTIISKVWSFTPAAGDTGTYYAKITAKDPSGLSDTVCLHITITAGDKQAPVLRFISPSKDTVIGADSITVSAICKDESGIASVKCYVDTASFTTAKSATVDSIYTATVKGLKAGQYSTVKFVATDASALANKDSLSISIKYDNDITKPSVSLVAPPKDTVSTNASSYTITLKCTDASGIASVTGKLDTASFTSSKVSDSVWSITISGLTENAFNTIVFTATDNSLRSNKSTLTLHIKYDPTMTDADGPLIKLISGPNSGDTVKNAVVTIVDSITDPSWLDSVYWTLNGKNLKLLTQSANIYTLADTLKSEGYNILIVTAKDKSSNGNRSTQTIILYITAPSITVQPSSQSILSGSPAVFSVVATGTGPLAYQWKKNAVEIPDAIKSSYTIDTVTLSDSGSYTVTVSNSVGTITSQAAILTVNYAPAITEQPLSQTLYLNQTTTFTVVSTGNPVPTYQWYKNGAVITGATNASYTISSPGIGDSGKYTVAVMNNVDTVLSDTAKFYALFKSVVAGSSSDNPVSFFLKTDGTVWACGDNTLGQLGDGTTDSKLAPVQITNMNNVQSIAVGSTHSLFLKYDGTLWACGNNGSGQLGDGTTISHLMPVQMINVNNVLSMAASGDHSLILKKDGTVWSCGINTYGQLGDGTTTSHSTPVQITSIIDVQSVAAGVFQSLMLKVDGTLWACGHNYYGSLGDGTTIDRYLPVQVTALGNNVKKMSASGSFSMLLKNDGTLWACGYNGSGQLGDGTTTDHALPAQVNNISNVQGITSGGQNSLILKTDASLWGCGNNSYGQLGIGSTNDQNTPVQINNMSNIQTMASGEFHSLILKKDGTVWSFGNNSKGQLGDGTTIDRSAPVQVSF